MTPDSFLLSFYFLFNEINILLLKNFYREKQEKILPSIEYRQKRLLFSEFRESFAAQQEKNSSHHFFIWKQTLPKSVLSIGKLHYNPRAGKQKTPSEQRRISDGKETELFPSVPSVEYRSDAIVYRESESSVDTALLLFRNRYTLYTENHNPLQSCCKSQNLKLGKTFLEENECIQDESEDTRTNCHRICNRSDSGFCQKIQSAVQEKLCGSNSDSSHGYCVKKNF